VAEARREIAVLRSALEDARLDRRRNEEYETLRRACAKLPKRDATLAACERLEREIAEMEAEEEKAARRFDERRARVDALADAVDALEEDVADDGRAEEEPDGIAADRNVGAVAMETD
jgi:chromosome segregation ATPase